MFNLKFKSKWHQTSLKIKCGVKNSNKNTVIENSNPLTKILVWLFELIAIIEVIKYIIIPLLFL